MPDPSETGPRELVKYPFSLADGWAYLWLPNPPRPEAAEGLCAMLRNLAEDAGRV